MLTYRINERVVLAGQPEPEDWSRVAKQGYRTVINMRSDPERAAIEGRNAEQAGLSYLHLPLPTYEIEPEHIASFRAAIEQADEGGLMIHCRTASRVALLWMLDRIVNEGWTQEQAEAELRAAGYAESSMETFTFCAEDYFERMDELQPDTQSTRSS
jgi:uncharacterized protein (TIGR01244 family)